MANPGGMNMQDMFGKMMEMQEKMNAAQDELADKTVTAEAGGGMVKVTANGAQEITGIDIDPEAVDPDDLELLEDLVIAGVNKALEDASDMAQEEMKNSMGGMLPQGMDLSQLGL
ncbi:YbaB/EbfC family nucleoid-associated protein [Salinibacter altiplanensis]|uniref:YbaB/EbfC family nucleoid-associated protein n=1 Tax=Salinibacter altiplanensis TaxID=1803181 RepID=UPI001E6567CE|nr:YbaB/EbfC family nucleoid-associated protein [Salinibacter altiplanensis]